MRGVDGSARTVSRRSDTGSSGGDALEDSLRDALVDPLVAVSSSSSSSSSVADLDDGDALEDADVDASARPPSLLASWYASVPRASDGAAAAPTADDLMSGVEPLPEIQRAMTTADLRYAAQAERSDPTAAHLEQEAQVRGVKRRKVEIRSPADRLALAAEDRREGVHYAQLTQAPGPGADPLVVGRLQDPKNANLPRERHIYEEGVQGAPSYPKEAAEFTKMAAAAGGPAPVFQQIQQAMLVNPLSAGTAAEQRHLMTTANILAIAEQRRDPYMGLSSAQTIAHAANPASGLTPKAVFGERSGKKNEPGRLPASGTGATAQFRDFREAIAAGEEPASADGRRLFENIAEQHLALMREGIDQRQVEALHDEGVDREFIEASQLARMRSAATREAAIMTGQLPYRLRSLKRKRD